MPMAKAEEAKDVQERLTGGQEDRSWNRGGKSFTTKDWKRNRRIWKSCRREGEEGTEDARTYKQCWNFRTIYGD
jgi:hypothetical protein